MKILVTGTTYFTSVLLVPVLASQPWPKDVAQRLQHELDEGLSDRVLLLDLTVSINIESWLDEMELAETLHRGILPNLRIIPWNDEMAPSSDQAEGSAGVAVARFCAAVMGARDTIQEGAALSDTRKLAQANLVARFSAAAPAADAYCYLPTSSERTLLDLPQWDTSPTLTLQALGSAMQQSVQRSSLRNLVSHYLVKEGTKWRRKPIFDTPFARAIIKQLQTRSLTADLLRDKIQEAVVIPNAAELTPAMDWLLEKLRLDGQIVERLDGWNLVDIKSELKKAERDVRELQTGLKESLISLTAEDGQRLLSVNQEASALLERFRAPGGGRVALEACNTRLADLKDAQRRIEAARMAAIKESEIDIADAVHTLAELRKDSARIHAAWRQALGFDELLLKMEQSIGALSTNELAESDRRARIKIEYARFGAARDEFRRRYRSQGDSPKEILARAVIKGGFKTLRVAYAD